MTRLLHGPHGDPLLGALLIEKLDSKDTEAFAAAIAFVKHSGVEHLAEALTRFGGRGGVTRIAVGVDLNGSTSEGLRLLLESVRGDARITVVHNENGSTFHPKVYLFDEGAVADLIVGSGNLTAGGLFTNYEAGVHVSLSAGEEKDAEVLSEVKRQLREWTTPDGRLVQELTPGLLDRLIENGYVVTEAEARERRRRDRDAAAAGPRGGRERLFPSIPIPAAPRVDRTAARAVREVARDVGGGATEAPFQTSRGFVMTLKQTDVGTGQKTPGTSRRSPEIFIPLVARDFDPDFWGWDAQFTEDAGKPRKFDRPGVRMRMGTETIDVNMMTWPDKHDFRLRSEPLRSAGSPGDILRIERTHNERGFEYYVEVIPHGTTMYDTFLGLCTNKVRNSDRLWGYYD
jgi:HKD family nuclease